jgi:hypothetical protein
MIDVNRLVFTPEPEVGRYAQGQFADSFAVLAIGTNERAGHKNSGIVDWPIGSHIRAVVVHTK